MRIPNGPGSPCGIGLASTHRCRGCTRRPSSLGFQIMLARFLCWLSRHFASRLAGTARYYAATPMHRRNGRNRVRRSIPIVFTRCITEFDTPLGQRHRRKTNATLPVQTSPRSWWPSNHRESSSLLWVCPFLRRDAANESLSASCTRIL